jgi:hypothetical protein
MTQKPEVKRIIPLNYGKQANIGNPKKIVKIKERLNSTVF